MLTVKELKERIANVPDETKVAVNCDVSEDQDMATKTMMITRADAPYAKGDNVWDIYGIDDDEEILFIT